MIDAKKVNENCHFIMIIPDYSMPKTKNTTKINDNKKYIKKNLTNISTRVILSIHILHQKISFMF